MVGRWLLVFLASAAPLLNAGAVNVELFEKVPAGHEFELTTRQPTERYTVGRIRFRARPHQIRECRSTPKPTAVNQSRICSVEVWRKQRSLTGMAGGQITDFKITFLATLPV